MKARTCRSRRASSKDVQAPRVEVLRREDQRRHAFGGRGGGRELADPHPDQVPEAPEEDEHGVPEVRGEGREPGDVLV